MTPEVSADNTADLPKPPSEPDSHSNSANERQSSDWDVRNAPKNYISLVAAHVATAFFSFASVWLVTRHLGAEGYGAIVAVVAASQLVQIFLSWSSTALARFGIEEFVETGRITRSFWMRTFILVPNLAVVVLLSGFWLGPVASWLKIPEPAVWLIGAHLVATALWLHIQFAMQGAKMLRLQGAMLAVERGLTFVILLAAVGLSGLSLQLALWAYILPAASLTLVGILVIRPYVALSGIVDAAHFRKMLVFSLPLIPYAIVGYLSTSQLDAFFITQYLSTTDLGIYAVAAQINGLAMQLPILANTLLLSLLVSLKSSGREDAADGFFRNVIPTITLVWAFGCMLVGTLGAVLLPAAFGQDFEAAVNPLWVLLSSSVIALPVLIGYATLSNAHSKTYIPMYASVLAAISNVVFNLLLIPHLGLTGCAWASVLASLVYLVVYYYFLTKEGHLSKNWVFQSLMPIIVGSVILSIGTSLWVVWAVFILITTFVAVSQLNSVRYTARFLESRFN